MRFSLVKIKENCNELFALPMMACMWSFSNCVDTFLCPLPSLPQLGVQLRDVRLRRAGPSAFPPAGEEPGHGRLHAQPPTPHLGVAQLPGGENRLGWGGGKQENTSTKIEIYIYM